VFCSKTNSIPTGKHCAGFSSFWNKWLSFMRYMCFFNSAE
jgi:hypothetical protein